MDSSTGQVIRLNKFLAERIGVSRREADDLIAAGKVTVDGQTAQIGDRIDKNAKVCYNKKVIPFETEFLYLALNKPEGYVCSRKRQGDAPTIYELLPEKYHSLKTVGRLDKDSCGLILLTNDGDFAFQMTHPKFVKTKVYEVILDKPLAPLHQQEIADFGLQLPDGVSRLGLTRPDDERKHWQVEMSEGRNRQIRRTFAAVGYEVKFLKRLQFGKYALGKLPEGAFELVEP